MHMKRTLTILLLLVSTVGFATGQVPDILIWKNDTISLQNNPLESYSKIDELNLFAEKEIVGSTSCLRGYIAEWRIIDNNLYLSNIFSCDYSFSENAIKSNLDQLFPAKHEKGMVLADWYTGSLSVPSGELIHSGLNIYQFEWILTIHNGKIVKEEKFDNSSSYISVYTQNQDSLTNFITNNIDWDNIPTLDKGAHKVYGIIKSGNSKTEFNVEIKCHSENKKLNKEALRILKSLPEFDFYIKAGEVQNVIYTIPLVFMEKE